jgi:hypothetical protein
MPGSSCLLDTNIFLRVVKPDCLEYATIREYRDRHKARGALLQIAKPDEIPRIGPIEISLVSARILAPAGSRACTRPGSQRPGAGQ